MNDITDSNENSNVLDSPVDLKVGKKNTKG